MITLKPFSIESVESDSSGETGADILQVRVTGYLDAHTVSTFEKTMEDLLKPDRRRVIMDLADLNYISSAGIGALMVLLQQLRRRQGDMVLLQPSPKVFKILDLLGFTKIFHIAQDRDSAMRVFA
jgi:anti-sigma B factor antagonist